MPMDRLLSLYQKLNDSGTQFYIWDLHGDKAVTLEVDGSYGIFMDFATKIGSEVVYLDKQVFNAS